MPRRLYWCGDDIFRGCILREALKQAGLKVALPEGVTAKGYAAKRGSLYRLADATRLLAERGCRELAEIDATYNVKGLGDIDLAAWTRGNSLYTAEAKTRLIIRGLNSLQTLREMLEYHLAEPGRALQAWKRLETRGLVKPGYDNPASIAELTRAAVAAYQKFKPQTLIVGIATVSYAKPLLQTLKELAASTARYLQNCSIPVAGHAVIVFEPTGLNEDTIPVEATLYCHGDACNIIAAKKHTINLHWTHCPQPLGCSTCNHRRKCPVAHTPRTSRQHPPRRLE